MSWKQKNWQGTSLRSEDFAGAIESEFDTFKTQGDVTLNQLEEVCKEIVTLLANWVDELEDDVEQKAEKIGKLEDQIEEMELVKS